MIEEIRDDREKCPPSLEEEMIEGYGHDNGIVLVACKDEHSCMQLEDCMTKGPHKVMKEEWEKYLLSKVELQSLTKNKKKKGKEPKGFGVLDGVIPAVSCKKAEVSSISKREHEALLEAASKISKRTNKDTAAEETLDNNEDNGECRRGRGKGKKKKKISAVIENDEENAMTGKTVIHSSENGRRRVKEAPGDAGSSLDQGRDDPFLEKGLLHKHAPAICDEKLNISKPIPPLYFHALDSDQHVLDILQPSVIILYHPDMDFVREIEIYKSENSSRKIKVYFLFYEESTEVQKYEASIRRENGAFESLIRQKSLMMIPVEQDMHVLGLDNSSEPQSIASQNQITRKAGGRKEADKETQVIVDMREFMSSLPNVLHQKGMRIIPVTLEVGDYILSPLICVERKSIQDLFGSFASGRLYHQVEMMSRYYRIPVLLIEFSQDKSFSFQSATDIGDDVTPNNIISKLSLLVLHFPRLRIVWSRSLHATAEIFASLKANQDEPDEAKSIRVGVPSEDGIIENDVRAENYNTAAVEFLRRLPGVTDSNYRTIMEGCKSLAELALIPLERLAELMGGQKAAKMLRDFLDAKYPTML